METILRRGPVIPVVTVDSPDVAVRLAEALLAGGVTVIEITLRTPRALDAIAAVSRAFPEMAVGAGTVLDPTTFAYAVDAGASFVVSPGTTPALLDFAAASGVPYLPGVATISEVMAARERGLRQLKLFPATAIGGLPLLDAWAPVLSGVVFCPTGGITLASARDWLARPSVACVGGSWLTPKAAVAAGDYAEITRLAAESAALTRG